MKVISTLRFRNNSKTEVVYVTKICISVCFVMCYFLSLVSADCQLYKHSSGQDPDEVKLLKVLDPLKGQSFSAEQDNYTYDLRICEEVSPRKPAVGLLQYETNDKNKNFSLGRIDEVELMGGTNWIVLQYKNGSQYHSFCNQTNRTSRIMIICDPSTKGTLRVLGERRHSDQNASAMCFYLFELGSSVACNSQQELEAPHSLSSGSVFCIIFFTITGIYLLLGFLYQRIVVGAKGLEQIPNYAFWRSFGNLQADGCDFICRCGPRQESQAYRGIDDRIRTDEERDDQLLNM